MDAKLQKYSPVFSIPASSRPEPPEPFTQDMREMVERVARGPAELPRAQFPRLTPLGPSDKKPHHGHGKHEHHKHGMMAAHLKSEAAELIAHKLAHAGAEVAEAATSQAAEQVVSHHRNLLFPRIRFQLSRPDTVTDVLETTESSKLVEGAAHVNHVTQGLTVALGVGAAVSGVITGPMIYIGVKEIREGLAEKDLDKTLEGVGGVTVGIRSGMAAATLASMAFGGPELAAVAGVTSKCLAPLGVLHGSLDMVIGARHLARGHWVKGGLDLTFGGAVVATAITSDLVPLGIAGLALIGKVVHGVMERRKLSESE
ncbi:MAG: hypothetical protein KC910_31935 [Candidatus Eremiobacteraeota bacterium]|nr:hypothetical protein [Candidatus Eremiobacteraeota bacterium]